MRESPRRGTATKERILEAALDTLRDQGFAETTARAIARRGGFNQALIFYHFGSVANMLLEAFQELSEVQAEKYRSAAEKVSSLTDLVTIARRLHDDDLETGSVTAVTQLMAAATGPQEGRPILDRFEEWIRIVQEALNRALDGSPIGGLVSTREAAYAISAMFLGIELMTRLDPERSEADAVFDMMASVARLVEDFAP
ncbi:MAG: TetR/AcrR family transcriptional regulator [Actinomycetota bacterium]